MARTEPAWSRSWELTLLGIALAAVATNVFLVHWDPLTEDHNFYPVHLDEYIHWGYAKAMAEDASLSFRDPFSGAVAPDSMPPVAERGFHAFLVAFQGMTDTPWPVIFTYGPLVVALFLAVLCYVLARRWGGGIYAVLFLAAVPTTLRFLGPGFFVPIAFAVPLLLAGILVLDLAEKHARAWILGLVIVAATWTVHAMAALTITALALVYVVVLAVTARERLARSFAFGAAVLLPFLLATPVYAGYLDIGVETPILPAELPSVRMFGWAAFALAAIGAARMMAAADPHTRALGTALGTVLLALMIVIAVRAVWGIDAYRLYDRSVFMAFTLSALLAGVGVASLVDAVRSVARRHGARRAGTAATLVACGFLLVGGANAALSVQAQIADPEYLVLNDATYARYEYAAEVTRDVPGRALVDGVGTMAFSNIADRPTLFVMDPGAEGQPLFVREFFANGANDTALLVETRTTVVLTDQAVLNEDLVPLGNGVYVLRPDYVARLG